MKKTKTPPLQKGEKGQTFTILEKKLKILLDVAEFQEFWQAEGTVKALKAQRKSASGFSMVRPPDCEHAYEIFDDITSKYEDYFRMGDQDIIERFQELISDFLEFTESLFPSQAINIRMLNAKVFLITGEPQKAIDLIKFHFERPYTLEGDYNQFVEVINIYGAALLSLGAQPEDPKLFYKQAILAVKIKPVRSMNIAGKLANLVATTPYNLPSNSLLDKGIIFFSKKLTRSRLGHWSLLKLLKTFYNPILGCLYFLKIILNSINQRWFSKLNETEANTLVTRAMGGIGDLTMMTAGLRVLSKMKGKPVDMAIPKKYFAIFENNPHVNLIDINGPPIDIHAYRSWKNLTQCPAGRYESKHRPNVKKGRVELFAKGMGVSKWRLKINGMHLDCFVSDEQQQFANSFVKKNKFGKRPILGIQPYSRDTYKNHIYINDYIEKLSENYDIILFHNMDENLPTKSNILSTASLSLSQSISLVPQIDAMVCVDSAFLHIAAAFDKPVVAMFGPTDGKTFTLHHRKVEMIMLSDQFACSPCWRNEDMPCFLTKQTGYSSCINSITFKDVEKRVTKLMNDENTEAKAVAI